ncbi:hypothetical protein ACWGIB_00200 [Streptomyces xiamenensis]
MLAWDEDRADWRGFRVDRIGRPAGAGHDVLASSAPEGVHPAVHAPGAGGGCAVPGAGRDGGGAPAAVGLPHRIEGPTELVHATRRLTTRAAAAS